jgi:diguanylate cyclase (GGDEF)-like protein
MEPTEVLLSHDPILVSLAAAICILGSFITVILYRGGRDAHGESRIGWMVLAGFAAGALIWTTHFVAMLAFKPGVQVGYSPVMTGAAFFTAVAGATAGLTVAAHGGRLVGLTGGAIVGLAASVMHLVGMSGFQIAGSLAWDQPVAALGILGGCALSALAFADRADESGPAVPITAPLALAASILLLHFMFVASMSVELQPDLRLLAKLIEPTILGYFVTAMIMLLVGTGLGATLIVRGAKMEARTQLRNVADAAVEGLVLTQGSTVLDFNQSFRTLIGPEAAAGLVGASVWSLFDTSSNMLAGRFEAMLMGPDGPIPVEVIVRASPTDGPERHVLAVRDLRERRAAEQRIRYLAHYDTLTGLPNRAFFQERLQQDLERMAATADQLAVMVLDLDHFKEVNDVHGHVAGDGVLKAVAGRLKSILGPGDFAARLGGDEFVIVQSAKEQPGAAAGLADRILAALSRPVDLAGQRLQIGATVGVAVFPPDGNDGQKLLANADLALYRAKDKGRNRVCFFTADMDEAIRERRILAQELKQAIEADQIEVYYQAQATVSTSEVVGFEALARWKHPKRGYIPPSEFIPIAEETDLILQLGEWMLRAVCREAATWTRPYRVAVNVSAVQFKKASLPELIHQILIETGMPPSRLELEITESALIEDLQRALDILRRIKALGVAIALDDFGTGYSSLSTLQAFPFDKLKIDKSFVEKIGSRHQASVIVTAVLGLGKSLAIPVLAEGVETELQLSFLNQESCEQAQGYLFGRPVSLDGIRHIVFDPGLQPALAADAKGAPEPAVATA